MKKRNYPEYLCDHTGKLSSGRVRSFLALSAAILFSIIGFIGVFMGKTGADGLAIFLVPYFLGAAFGGAWANKREEVKMESTARLNAFADGYIGKLTKKGSRNVQSD